VVFTTLLVEKKILGLKKLTSSPVTIPQIALKLGKDDYIYINNSHVKRKGLFNAKVLEKPRMLITSIHLTKTNTELGLPVHQPNTPAACFIKNTN
jgi:hypothetical protein